MFAVAGIGERRWIPNDPNGTDFVRPDHSVLDVDLNGVLYTASLAVQQMRRQGPNEKGLKGKSESELMSLSGKIFDWVM